LHWVALFPLKRRKRGTPAFFFLRFFFWWPRRDVLAPGRKRILSGSAPSPFPAIFVSQQEDSDVAAPLPPLLPRQANPLHRDRILPDGDSVSVRSRLH